MYGVKKYSNGYGMKFGTKFPIGQKTQLKNVKRRNAVEPDQKVIHKIGVKEAARILSDYITIKVPRAAMHDAAR